ncbi:hypothetical protein C5167_026188 [Papaver somniferum]|uniref:MATH and LRR domain-containing protein PFE0570w-like n=1 Tax=Papaver somniferum TaxID=3469 RepID=UPI000E6FE691|nr:MATH and LRR domain-containing protein PFE0570w-like [Papaver somniferum]RZC94457.1 hypothetical protein C5167_026188 [Papaver somniferum]
MRFSKFKRGELSSDSDYGYKGESSDSGYGYKGESSKRAKRSISFKNRMKPKQAERRFKYSSKDHIKSKSCSKSFTYKNIVCKNTAYRSSSPNFIRKKKEQLSSSSSEEYGVIRMKKHLFSISSDEFSVSSDEFSISSEEYGAIKKKRFHGEEDDSHKKDHKRRKLHNDAAFVGDSDYLKFLKSLTWDKENDEDDSDNYSKSENQGFDDVGDDEDSEDVEENEDYDDVFDDEDGDDDEENEDIHVDRDGEMSMNMGGNGIGVRNALNPGDANVDDGKENEDIQLDMDMCGESGNGIDVGDELDPQYKMFLKNLREDGKSYILEMRSEKGDFISIKYEEPLLSPSCAKRKSMPINDFHPFLDECKLELTPTADKSYCKFLKNMGVIGGSLIVIAGDIILPMGEHNKVTPSVLEKSLKNGFTCSKYLQFEEDNKDSISNLGKSVKDGLLCRDLKENPHKPQKSCDSQTDEDDMGSDCYRTEYEKKLEKCINMPYDEKELIDKWQLASCRKELERVRETRRRSVSYATEKTSRSYLDHHPALSEMVDRALARRDGCRALLLLRCLFFYNENVAHEGAFMPWVDPSFERMLSDPA